MNNNGGFGHILQGNHHFGSPCPASSLTDTGRLPPLDNASGMITTTSDLAPRPESGIRVGKVVYTVADIRGMAGDLALARRNGEFPETSASSMDADVILHDYELLARLREVRGDPSEPPPSNYVMFRIEVLRRIRDRDDMLDEESAREAAARRVNTYMRALKYEHRYLEAACEEEEATFLRQRNGARDPARADPDAAAVAEQIFSVVEESLLDATGPLRLNVNRMDSQIHDVGTHAGDLHSSASAFRTGVQDLQSTAQGLQATSQDLRSNSQDMFSATQLLHSAHQNLHSTLNHATRDFNSIQRELNSAANSVDTTAFALGTQVEALSLLLQSQANESRQANSSMAHASSTANALSSMVDMLPKLVAESVRASVQAEVKANIQNLLAAHQTVLVDLQNRANAVRHGNIAESADNATHATDPTDALRAARSHQGANNPSRNWRPNHVHKPAYSAKRLARRIFSARRRRAEKSDNQAESL